MSSIIGTSDLSEYYAQKRLEAEKIAEEQAIQKQQEEEKAKQSENIQKLNPYLFGSDSILLSQNSGQMQNPNSILEGLDDGTITSEQAEAIQSAFQANSMSIMNNGGAYTKVPMKQL